MKYRRFSEDMSSPHLDDARAWLDAGPDVPGEIGDGPIPGVTYISFEMPEPPPLTEPTADDMANLFADLDDLLVSYPAAPRCHCKGDADHGDDRRIRNARNARNVRRSAKYSK